MLTKQGKYVLLLEEEFVRLRDEGKIVGRDFVVEYDGPAQVVQVGGADKTEKKEKAPQVSRDLFSKAHTDSIPMPTMATGQAKSKCSLGRGSGTPLPVAWRVADASLCHVSVCLCVQEVAPVDPTADDADLAEDEI